MQSMSLEEYRRLNKQSAKKSKYNAKRVTIDGILFHSTWEGERYSQLKILERAGDIQDLRLQVPFKLEIDSVQVAVYVADFTYHMNGIYIVEDAKGGAVTKDYALKKKLMLAIHKIAIFETRKEKKTRSKSSAKSKIIGSKK